MRQSLRIRPPLESKQEQHNRTVLGFATKAGKPFRHAERKMHESAVECGPVRQLRAEPTNSLSGGGCCCGGGGPPLLQQ